MRAITRVLLVCSVAVVAAGCELFGGGSGGPGTGVPVDGCDDPESLAAWQDARTALQKGDDQRALPLLERVAARCPDLVRAHLAYQDAARRAGGDVEQRMVAFYSKAEDRRSPVPAYLRARLAETAYAQANDLQKILSGHPGFAWAHLSLGRVNRGQGRLSEALGDFERAVGRDAELAEARLERAQVLAELGRNEESAIDYRTYLRARPADTEAAREFVTLLLYKLGRVDEAMDWIKRLQSNGDRSIALRMDLAAAIWRRGVPRSAVEEYIGVLVDAPQTARAALNIGLLYYEIVPKTDEDKRRYWPRARAAFRMFLATTEPSDGHEQFERTWAVPYRLGRIADLLGAGPERAPTIDDLRWPED
jgi:tetratricopeptide (TPR) repeat protein